MQKSSLFNRIKKKLNYTTVTLALGGAILIAPPVMAFSDAWLRAQFTQFTTQVFTQFQSQLAGAINNQIAQAQKIFQLSNQLDSAISGALSQSTQNTMNKVLGGGLSDTLSRSGTNMSEIDGKPGKVNARDVNEQTSKLKDVKNPVDAITKQTELQLQNQMKDRLNVSSLLDEKPKTGSCQSVSGDKCTILKLLREKEAMSLQKLHNQSLAAVNLYASVAGDQWHKVLLDTVYAKGAFGSGQEMQKVLNFLTPENSIPLGYDKDLTVTHNLERARILSDVIAGSKNDINIMARTDLSKLGRDDASQVDAMSKLAKVQLARNAIINVHNEQLHDTLNSQFKACVARPDNQDVVGNSLEQHMVALQSLQRCTNLALLQMQQRELEAQRLQGAILLTLLDIYAVQAPQK